MTPTATPAPSQPAKRAYFGMGCTTLVALALLLCVAGGVGAFYYFRQTYSATEPLTIPDVEVRTSDAPEPLETINSSTTGTTTAPGASQGTSVAGGPVPIQETATRWEEFEKAANKHREARIELTASEINALLQNGKKTRGKAFVSIDNNVARVRVSIPLKEVMLLNGRYLNGEITVESSPDGDPAKAKFSNITMGKQPVSDAILDRQMFGMKSIRGVITDWLDDQDIETFRIENNRVIGGTRSDR